MGTVKHMFADWFVIEEWSSWRVELFEEIHAFYEAHGDLPTTLIGNQQMGEKMQGLHEQWGVAQEAGEPELPGFIAIAQKLSRICSLTQCALDYIVDDEVEDGGFFMARMYSQDEEVPVITMPLQFPTWSTWDEDLVSQTTAFHQKHRVYPNLLCANPVTFARLDLFAVNGSCRTFIEGPNGERPEPDEFPSLRGFSCDAFHLTFCLEETLEDDHFELIYDPAAECVEFESIV